MISAQQVEKLRNVRASGNVVLSLYVPVPLDPAQLRGLPALVADLINAAQAAADPGSPGRVGPASGFGDRAVVQNLVHAHARNLLGHTLAVFACGQLGLLEALPLPGQLPAQCTLASRPHIRPLLAVLQRHPDYLAAIVGKQHAWLFSVTAGQMETIARPEAAGVRSSSYGGWYGLEARRVHQRVIQLAQRHYRHVATILADQMRAGRPRPLIIGGHEDGIAQLVRVLPHTVRETFAGSFSADPLALTLAQARMLADRVIDGWVTRREREAVAAVLGTAPGEGAAIGLPACLAAVNAGAASLLLVADDGLIPGFVCARCGQLTTAPGDCPDGGAATRAVPDLLDEMAVRVLGSGGEVIAVREAPERLAVQLRYSVAGV